MYIFELLGEIFKKKQHKIPDVTPVDEEVNALIENPQDCEHLFMPLDSTNTMFACKYCGIVLSKDKLNSTKTERSD